MVTLGLVGDCSQGDAMLLGKALDTALKLSDVVVQLGDVNSSDNHSGYTVVTGHRGLWMAGVPEPAGSSKLLVIPGNHDTQGPGDWSKLGGLPKQWIRQMYGVTLIGLDNSGDAIGDAGWDILTAFDAQPNRPAYPIFVFVHKSLSRLILPDGTESSHVVAEGAPCPDADKLKAWVAAHNATVCCGHFHGSALMRTSYGTVVLEGRGGSPGYAGKAMCGWTQIFVQPDGWTAHPVDLT